ncbi:MAG: FAD-binding oxidoreductase [Rhizobiaceae bacterium]|nr:FAD-binding oxidoreductase [Rhizobiaceae bacterium]
MAADGIMVIGGGVIGRSIALGLQAAGRSVTILDPPQSVLPASLGNAGHIAVEQTAPLASLATLRALPGLLLGRNAPAALPLRAARHWLPFGLRMMRAAAPRRFRAGEEALTGLLGDAIPAWRRLLGLAGAGDLMREDGHLVLSESEASLSRLLLETAGGGRLASAAPLAAGSLADLSQRFGVPIVGGVGYAGTAQIVDLAGLLCALREAFAERGGVCLPEHALAVEPDGSAVRVATAEGGLHRAAMAVIAAGVASKRLMVGLGHAVPLIAERGYHIETDSDAAPEPPIVFADRHVLLASFRGRTRITGVTEFSAPDTPPDPRHWERLERHALDLGIAPAAPFRRWVGSRPTLPDYLPALGRLDRTPQIAYAFGHQHLGLTLAARTAELVVALIEGGGPDLAPFAVERFVR